MSVTKDEFKKMLDKSRVKLEKLLGKRKDSKLKSKEFKFKKKDSEEKPDYDIFLQ
ncbi:hypothetical protein [uncultured Ilyobacter sp.]|uniref:hypothetical protein n=1 Tax=uncultured Ilyobacter sp. TaxID=544433 RepID=UPI0029C82AD6|nr:hypothetical protein [uncultured Ilyobacter sp.]